MAAPAGEVFAARAEQLGRIPVVPPNPNRFNRREYDRFAFRRRNEV